MPTPHSLLTSLVLLSASYLSAASSAPPSVYKARKQSNLYTADTFYFVNTVVSTIKATTTATMLYHALIALLYPPSTHPTLLANICPHTDQLTRSQFTWSPTHLLALTAILIGSSVRLSACSGLGKDFTLRLAVPDRLVTRGLYSYVQHPGYTGYLLVLAGCLGLGCRWDASAGACFLPGGVLGALSGWGAWVAGAIVGAQAVVFWVRVGEEEEMLRGRFGDDWVRWNKGTARFVPFIW
ncbi:methyltransferase family protein [Aspergillus candidus]|uniref:Protein-S-isoprenylcysteine O-methyltransferase n=1 Tax=Aspergillus candidus TaxID=41067 RepID=A0A2I2FL60_ASPCN|nr:hypothetical protein BDW47DRAFT_122915 [Aspergillus candidus]PLB41361.1 hypothetical protein BDW47DRAFT_122915 [Aspergillus candidus]